MSKKPDIKEGFKGMDFAKESKLFNEMPDYKPKKPKKRTLNELRQTKDTVYTNPNTTSKNHTSLRQDAALFIEEKFSHFKKYMTNVEYEDVITALVEYKNNH